MCNAIVWLDTRTAALVERLVNEKCAGDRNKYRALCGLPLSTYFSAVKLAWLLENNASVKQAMTDGTLMVGTVDSWLIYQLSGKTVHVTDVTNASRTMLMDLKTCQWSTEMLTFFGVNESLLPTIKSSSEIYCHVKQGPLAGVPVSGCLGD